MFMTVEEMIKFLMEKPSDSKILINDSNGNASKSLICHQLLRGQTQGDTLYSPAAEPIVVSKLIEFLHAQPSDAYVVIETSDGGSFERLTLRNLDDAREQHVTNEHTKTEQKYTIKI